jgi:hypothetical protein
MLFALPDLQLYPGLVGNERMQGGSRALGAAKSDRRALVQAARPADRPSRTEV